MLADTDCLVLQHGRVPDGVLDALRRHLSDVELLELTDITTLDEQHAVLSRALRTELDDVDEPVAEVRVPGAEDTIVPPVPRAR